LIVGGQKNKRMQRGPFMIVIFSLFFTLIFCAQQALATDASSFLQVKAWQCTFSAEQKSELTAKTGPAGMAYGPKRQFFQVLGATGIKAESPGGNTDSYRETMEQSVKGKIRLHYVYDGGPDGIQIAGWNNGTAEVHAKHYFEGTEQNKTIMRDKTTTYDGPAKFSGDEYSPAFQIWIYPDQGTYSLEYHLSRVLGDQVEHCHMKGKMESDRKKMESATDANMPLGGMMAGLTRISCPSERKGKVHIEGGALSAMVENVPLPSSSVIEGEGESQFVDSKGVKFRWSCKPE